MSGPVYPAPPEAGSNGIGLFAIGVSQIGDIPAFNYWETVTSRYANSAAITAIVGSAWAATDQTINLQLLYDDIWNIATCNDYGLAVWGRIVGVGNVIPYTAAPPSFGFHEGGGLTFGEGAFSAGSTITTNYTLGTEAYRTLILAKAAANITNCSIASINSILQLLFPNRGNAYVVDGENMTMTYTFNFTLTPTEIAIVEQSGVLPVPTGVQAIYSYL